jgi:hypothetical protein
MCTTNKPGFQAVRGVNPVLQVIFTFAQMYFVFMNARVSRNCHKKVEFVDFVPRMRVTVDLFATNIYLISFKIYISQLIC